MSLAIRSRSVKIWLGACAHTLATIELPLMYGKHGKVQTYVPLPLLILSF